MIRFKSKVVRMNEMGGKFVVEFKEKAFETGVDEPVVDSNVVEMYATQAEADKAVNIFFSQ